MSNGWPRPEQFRSGREGLAPDERDPPFSGKPPPKTSVVGGPLSGAPLGVLLPRRMVLGGC